MTKPFDLDIDAIKQRSARHVTAILEGRDDRTEYPYLALTSTGRRSGKPRSTALIYGRDGDRFVIVASLGGAPKSPQWFFNLEGDPEATVHVDGRDVPVTARVADGEERARLWEMMVEVYPPYSEYQLKTERLIPVVVLEPKG